MSTYQLHTIPGVEIFSAGTHRGEPYTRKDLDRIVRNFYRLQGDKRFGDTENRLDPTCVLGHEEDEDQMILKYSGLPAAGVVKRLRRKGDKLIADFADVPEPVANAVKNRNYRKVSAELYDNFEDGGKDLGLTLRRVALLGGEIPEIKNLADLPFPQVQKHSEQTAKKLYTFSELRFFGNWDYSKTEKPGYKAYTITRGKNKGQTGYRRPKGEGASKQSKATKQPQSSVASRMVQKAQTMYNHFKAQGGDFDSPIGQAILKNLVKWQGESNRKAPVQRSSQPNKSEHQKILVDETERLDGAQKHLNKIKPLYERAKATLESEMQRVTEQGDMKPSGNDAYDPYGIRSQGLREEDQTHLRNLQAKLSQLESQMKKAQAEVARANRQVNDTKRILKNSEIRKFATQWQPGRSESGSVKATNPATGQTLYGKQAEAALRGKQPKQQQPSGQRSPAMAKVSGAVSKAIQASKPVRKILSQAISKSKTMAKDVFNGLRTVAGYSAKKARQVMKKMFRVAGTMATNTMQFMGEVGKKYGPLSAMAAGAIYASTGLAAIGDDKNPTRRALARTVALWASKPIRLGGDAVKAGAKFTNKHLISNVLTELDIESQKPSSWFGASLFAARQMAKGAKTVAKVAGKAGKLGLQAGKLGLKGAQKAGEGFEHVITTAFGFSEGGMNDKPNLKKITQAVNLIEKMVATASGTTPRKHSWRLVKKKLGEVFGNESMKFAEIRKFGNWDYYRGSGKPSGEGWTEYKRRSGGVGYKRKRGSSGAAKKSKPSPASLEASRSLKLAIERGKEFGRKAQEAREKFEQAGSWEEKTRWRNEAKAFQQEAERESAKARKLGLELRANRANPPQPRFAKQISRLKGREAKAEAYVKGLEDEAQYHLDAYRSLDQRSRENSQRLREITKRLQGLKVVPKQERSYLMKEQRALEQAQEAFDKKLQRASDNMYSSFQRAKKARANIKKLTQGQRTMFAESKYIYTGKVPKGWKKVGDTPKGIKIAKVGGSGKEFEIPKKPVERKPLVSTEPENPKKKPKPDRDQLKRRLDATTDYRNKQEIKAFRASTKVFALTKQLQQAKEFHAPQTEIQDLEAQIQKMLQSAASLPDRADDAKIKNLAAKQSYKLAKLKAGASLAEYMMHKGTMYGQMALDAISNFANGMAVAAQMEMGNSTGLKIPLGQLTGGFIEADIPLNYTGIKGMLEGIFSAATYAARWFKKRADDAIDTIGDTAEKMFAEGMDQVEIIYDLLQQVARSMGVDEIFSKQQVAMIMDGGSKNFSEIHLFGNWEYWRGKGKPKGDWRTYDKKDGTTGYKREKSSGNTANPKVSQEVSKTKKTTPKKRLPSLSDLTAESYNFLQNPNGSIPDGQFLGDGGPRFFNTAGMHRSMLGTAWLATGSVEGAMQYLDALYPGRLKNKLDRKATENGLRLVEDYANKTGIKSWPNYEPAQTWIAKKMGSKPLHNSPKRDKIEAGNTGSNKGDSGMSTNITQSLQSLYDSAPDLQNKGYYDDMERMMTNLSKLSTAQVQQIGKEFGLHGKTPKGITLDRIRKKLGERRARVERGQVIAEAAKRERGSADVEEVKETPNTMGNFLDDPYSVRANQNLFRYQTLQDDLRNKSYDQIRSEFAKITQGMSKAELTQMAKSLDIEPRGDAKRQLLNHLERLRHFMNMENR